MPSLTSDAVRALAPDAGALKAGQGLANSRHWVALGRSEQALWGSCQGSGKDPYEVAVDLSGPAAKCTCPSRKFPCKHGLGLMFMAANDALGGIKPEPPAVTAWLADRSRRAATAAKRETDAADDPKAAEARARDRERRAAQREGRVADGLVEFRRWLEDLARRGLAEVDDLSAFENAAARLVDAQAGELARDVRALGLAVATEGPLSEDVIDRIGRLNLVCETWDRRDTLNPHLGAELRSRIGWTIREADLPDDDAITDRWSVVARRHEDEGRLRETRTWLRASEAKRWAVLVDFAPRGTEPSNEPAVGSVIEGRVAFYPGASRLRGALRAGWAPGGDAGVVEGAPDFAAALAEYVAAVKADPFVERWPVVVASVALWWDRDEGRLSLLDAAGSTVPLAIDDEAVTSLIAFSGGRSVHVAGEWDGRSLTALAAGDGQTWIPLPGSETARPIRATVRSLAARKRKAAGPSTTDAADAGADDPAWSALVAWATLGTGRAAPDPVLAPFVDRMADRPSEQRLLALMSALTARRRVGRSPQKPAPGIRPLDPAPPESRSRPPRSVVVALGDASASRTQLDERLRLLDERGWLIPPELLPTPLFAPPLSRPATLGHRAGWLSRHISGYRPRGVESEELQPEVLVERLELRETSPIERYAHFRALRGHDPGRAREWLAAAWPKLSMNDKLMVAGLQVGLSDADVPFLESIFGEKNVERRNVVAGLLARCPGSAFVARLEGRGRSFVERKGRLSQGLRLMVPPDDACTEMESDGCVVPVVAWAGGPDRTPAERAFAALEWHVRMIHPSRWSDWVGIPGEAIVREFTSLSPKNYGVPKLHFALAEAAILHRASAFAVTLIETAERLPVEDGLWKVVPQGDLERVALRAVHTQTDPGPALRALDGRWSRNAITTIEGDEIVWAGRLAGNKRWEALAWLRAVATHGPLELLPNLIARLEATDADSRDIVGTADARLRFAATVAQTGGTR